jgi:hypothetical protein
MLFVLTSYRSPVQRKYFSQEALLRMGADISLLVRLQTSPRTNRRSPGAAFQPVLKLIEGLHCRPTLGISLARTNAVLGAGFCSQYWVKIYL